MTLIARLKEQDNMDTELYGYFAWPVNPSGDEPEDDVELEEDDDSEATKEAADEVAETDDDEDEESEDEEDEDK